MRNRIKKAFISAIPVGLTMVAISGYVAVIRWHQLAKDPRGAAVAIIGLPVFVFVTYFFFALAGYTVRGDGTVEVPRRVAWSVFTLIAVSVIGALFYLFVS